jgi:hypothetical protein
VDERDMACGVVWCGVVWCESLELGLHPHAPAVATCNYCTNIQRAGFVWIFFVAGSRDWWSDVSGHSIDNAFTDVLKGLVVCTVII